MALNPTTSTSRRCRVASDLRRVEAAVLRLIDDLELSLVDDALFGTVRIDETKRNAPDVTLAGDFQRLSRNQRQLGLIAFGVDILTPVYWDVNV